MHDKSEVMLIECNGIFSQVHLYRIVELSVDTLLIF